MGKGEIARSEQFLLLPQCFQKTCTAGTEKSGLVGEKANIGNEMIGKRQNADHQNCLLFQDRNEQFLLFPQCFLPVYITFCHFRQI